MPVPVNLQVPQSGAQLVVVVENADPAGKLKPVAVDTQKLPPRLTTANLFKGTFQKKHLAFQTLELYQNFFLLKITTVGRFYFVVGKFLSGCNRTTRISLERETVVDLR